MNNPKFKDLSIDDLQWELDKAIENDNERRQKSIKRELDRRNESKIA